VPVTNQSVRDFFHDFARRTSDRLGSAWAFLVAIGVVVVWAGLGPHFGFSDTWQLVINTGTTIVTFLMVFLIQNTQNRDAAALHLKLDELLRGVEGARTRFVDLENLSEAELEDLRKEFQRIHEQAARRDEEAVTRVKRQRHSSRSRTRAARTRRARGRSRIS
jgi:low affinity Fe/Cu permease